MPMEEVEVEVATAAKGSVELRACQQKLKKKIFTQHTQYEHRNIYIHTLYKMSRAHFQTQ